MKVLYITNSVGMGGDSVAILNLLAVLVTKGIEPFVLYPKSGVFSIRLSELGIKGAAIDNPMDIYPYNFNIIDYLKFPYRILKLLYRRKSAFNKLCHYIDLFKPDIIHTNVGPIHLGYEASKKYGIPHVWHIREYQIEDFGMHPFPSVRLFKKKLCDSNNHNIAITKEIFNHFSLNKGKDRVIYDGVINKNERPAINSNKKNYILFVGRLEDAKGIKTLINDFILYRKNGGRKDLLIAGTGNEEYIIECKRLIPCNLENVVHFLGQRSDVFDLMYNASLLVVPSRNEGFGFITAEAMFNGTLVIGRDSGGTKEQFDNGLELCGEEIAYRYTNDGELVSLLLKLDNKPDNSKLNKAQDIVCRLYDIEAQSLKVFSLYKKILLI